MDTAQVERIRKRLIAEARDFYEIGYKHGMKVGEHLKWWMLDSLARDGWDLRRWLATNIEEPIEGGKTILVPLRTLLGLDDLGLENTSLGLGFAHALKDLWETVVRSHGSGTPDGSGGDTS